jgi:hypothetical protein
MEYYTVSQAAALAQRSKAMITYLVRNGTLAARRDGKYVILIEAQSLKNYITARQRPGTYERKAKLT